MFKQFNKVEKSWIYYDWQLCLYDDGLDVDPDLV